MGKASSCIQSEPLPHPTLHSGSSHSKRSLHILPRETCSVNSISQCVQASDTSLSWCHRTNLLNNTAGHHAVRSLDGMWWLSYPHSMNHLPQSCVSQSNAKLLKETLHIWTIEACDSSDKLVRCALLKDGMAFHEASTPFRSCHKYLKPWLGLFTVIVHCQLVC